ncbi:MAG: hypothetical protein BWY43_00496 [candidate division WS2 bacterium ADurb.Bin280]|uniref:Uncharacterized protein n=1 Tax=candidate division WS2 bacterium ADurb.Bin280 TaxID=1852829 RepID=A0A1V5SD31_9BACT|nr:MAG: hypothetical protein BWY43_00496 [candidate division WS2 bacterium ADurb.Bin280]
MVRKYRKLVLYFFSLAFLVSFLFVFNKYYANADPINPQVGQENVNESVDTGRWKEDAEVTAVGKAAARAREVLNWALSIENAGFTNQEGGSILKSWNKIRDLLGVFYLIVLIVLGFGLIARAAWAERSRRVFVALIISFVAAYFSYAILSRVVQFTDEQIQQRLYTIHRWGDTGTTEEKHLRAQDLLTVSFSYQEFRGFRKVGSSYGEAIANHLLLVKATTLTNYVIAFIILLRIVILWGLVIFSPFVFPLFVFDLTKNVGVVWGREFFRWLILGPLFAVFISLVPYIWNQTTVPVTNTYQNQKAKNSGIPITVDKNILSPSSSSGDKTSQNVYESGTNIILSPPGNTGAELQKDDDISSGNNLSETDTYTRWIIALMMIWGAIALPFILLKVVVNFSIEAGRGITNIVLGTSAGQYISSAIQKNSPASANGADRTSTGLRLVGDKIDSKISQISSQEASARRIQRNITQNKTTPNSLPESLNNLDSSQNSPQVLDITNNVATSDVKPIAKLAQIEQSQQSMLSGSSLINSISNPQSASNNNTVQNLEALKQNIIQSSNSGDKQAQGLKNAITGNISSYLSGDVANEILEKDYTKFDQTLQKVFSPIEQEGQEQLKQIFGIQNAKNFPEIIDELAKKQDPRAQGAKNILSDIEQSVKLPPPQKNAALMEIGKNMSETENITDQTVRNNYSSIKSIINQIPQTANIGFASLQKDAQSYYEISSRDIVDNKIKGELAVNFTQSLDNLLEGHKQTGGAPSQNSPIATIEKVTSNIKNISTNDGTRGVDNVLAAAKRIADPQSAESEQEKQEYQQTKEFINDQAANGNKQALAIEEAMKNISKELEIDEAKNVKVTDIARLRASVREDQDFMNTKKLWLQNYLNYLNPYTKDKGDSLLKEINLLGQTLNDIISPDNEKKKEALKRVQKIIPFALLGNYKISDIAKYLLAKYDGASEALNSLRQHQEKKEVS